MNVSSRRSANTGQLVQSERLHTLGQLVAGVIHEMNNPLTIVHTNLHVLSEYVEQLRQLLAFYRETGVSNPTLEAYIEEIDLAYLDKDLPRILASCQDGASRAMSLVDELRRYSAGNTNQEVAPVDLRACLMSTVRLVESSFRNRVNFKLDIVKLPPIMGITGQIQQVLMNLLINACQSIDGRGEVTVHSESDGIHVTLCVTDTGGGIPEEILPRIFEPYFSTKSAADGTGLGLPITKRIVEKHGGRLEVRSTVGAGTTFIVVLPIEANPELDDGQLLPYDV